MSTTSSSVRFLAKLTERELRAVVKNATGWKLTLRQSLSRHLARKTRRQHQPLQIEICPPSPR